MSRAATKVDVCVCTFRREAIRETLVSLAGQELPDSVVMRVVVADNDAVPSAGARVREAAAALGLDLAYVHAPAGNISIARNAALDAAGGDWIAFIDDDEAADADWLSELLAAASATGADVVFGPVVPVFHAPAPAWMSDGSFHTVEPTFRNGEIAGGHAGNVLISRRLIARTGARFDVKFGRTGGEDTDFFDRLIRRGATMRYAPNAVARESVPSDRATMAWLVRRRFRYGQTHGAMIARRHPELPGRTREAARAGAKALACLGVLMINPFPPRRRAFWLLRGALHLGVVVKLFGLRTIVEYGGAEPVAQPAASEPRDDPA